MGRVFKVFDQERQSPVALKTLKACSPADRRRFESEVRTLSRLRHEGVVRLFDAGVAGNEIFFTMEILEGLPLDRFLSRPLPGEDEIQRLLSVAVKVLDALEHVHEAGLIHRDVKPSNVIVLPAPGKEAPPGGAGEIDPDLLLRDPGAAVKLLDFGLARELESAARLGQLPAGTPLYMSPEQIHGAPSERSDIYSLAAMLYHLVARQPPFSSLTAVLSRKPEPQPLPELNPACTPEVSSAIFDMMAHEPHRRPASAGDARERILSLLEPGRKRAMESPRLLPPAFTGRARELAALRQLFARAARGEGAFARIAGERGSGKTWLLRESGIASEALADFGLHPIRAAFRRGGAVHEGLREVFRDLLALVRSRRGVEGLRGALDPWGPALLQALGVELQGSCDETAPVAGAAGGAPDDAGSSAIRLARECLLEAGVCILHAAASIQPLFLALEDVQHAGDLELDILGRLVRALPSEHVAMAVTYRPESARDSRAFARWIADIEADGDEEPLLLGSLSDGEARALLERRLHPRGPISPELSSLLLSRSEGRPLELSRSLEALWENGAIIRKDGAWRLAGRDSSVGLPGVRGLRARLEALSPADRAILTAARVLAVRFDAALLERVAGRMDLEGEEAGGGGRGDEGDPRVQLRALARRGLLVEEEGEYALCHDLEGPEAGDLLEGRASGEELKALHKRAGAAILEFHQENAEGHFFKAAWHFAQAGDREQAFRLYLAAARHMSRTFANSGAAQAYRSALSLCDSPRLRSEVHEELGDLHARTGDYPAALEHLRQALPAEETAAPARGERTALLDKIGRVLHRQGEFAEALEVFRSCLEGSDVSAPARARALFRIGGIHLDQGDAARAMDCLEESLKLYEALGDPRQTAAVQFSLGVAEKSLNRLDLAVARFEAALQNAERSGSLLEAATTLNNLGNIHRAAGDDQKAVECLRRSIDTRERIGDRQGLAICLNNIARVHTFRGELGAARTSTEAALGIFAEIGDKKGVLIARCNLGELLHNLGEFDGARDLLRSTIQMAEKLKAHRLLESALCNLGALEIDAGEYLRAAEHLRRCLRTLPEDKPLELRAQALGLATAAALRLQDLEGAQDTLREALDIARELKMREKLGAIASQEVRFHLERGDPERAVEAGKAFLLDPCGMERLGTALLRLELGRAYRELGPDWADRTERELGAAFEAFESMGSPHNAAAARVELGIYWRLIGEEEVADELFRRAEEELRRVGVERRVEEVQRVRGLSG